MIMIFEKYEKRNLVRISITYQTGIEIQLVYVGL